MSTVVGCTQCGGMIEPLEDKGIVPMLVTHASFKGPVFHLAYFCCEKCLKAFVNENANGTISSIPCVVLPEEADLELLAGMPKLVLAPISAATDDMDKLFDEMADEMYEEDGENWDSEIADPYVDYDGEWDGDDDEPNDFDHYWDDDEEEE